MKIIEQERQELKEKKAEEKQEAKARKEEERAAKRELMLYIRYVKRGPFY